MITKTEEQQIRARLESDMAHYFASGHQVEQVPPGKSTPVDATNNWPQGFSREDNITFFKKAPRGQSND